MSDSNAPAELAPASSLERDVEKFLRYLLLERGRSNHTLAAYQADLRQYVAWLEARGITRLDEVTPSLVEHYTTGLHGSPRSVQRRLSSLRSLHAFLVDTRVTLTNPAAVLKGPSQPERLPKALGVAEVLRLLETVSGDDVASLRDRALLEVLYATGARVSEVVGLALDDVFGSDGSPAELLRVIGKGNKERIVPLGSHARRALEAYVVRARPVLAANAKRHSAALFLGLRGAALSRQSVWLILRGRAQEANITGPLSPHTLRHSCATHLIQGGADIRVVQELLGHQSVQTTQIYTKVTIDSLRDVYNLAHPRARG